MGLGCFLTIIATFVQAFAPRHNLGAFIGGRVLIGIGQGLALSTSLLTNPLTSPAMLTAAQPPAPSTSARSPSPKSAVVL